VYATGLRKPPFCDGHHILCATASLPFHPTVGPKRGRKIRWLGSFELQSAGSFSFAPSRRAVPQQNFLLSGFSSSPPILLCLPLHCGRIRILALDPIRRSAGTISRISPLRYDAFQANLAGVLEYERAVRLFHVLIELQAGSRASARLAVCVLAFWPWRFSLPRLVSAHSPRHRGQPNVGITIAQLVWQGWQHHARVANVRAATASAG
jgi:hypothetical protein